MIEITKISEIVNLIALGTNPDKIFLFGSYATGNATEDSDIDLLIIKETDTPRSKRGNEIQKLLIGTKVPADIIVFTNQEYEEEKSNKYSFLNSALRKSKVVYERKH